jgi:hypothetical protein
LPSFSPETEENRALPGYNAELKAPRSLVDAFFGGVRYPKTLTFLMQKQKQYDSPVFRSPGLIVEKTCREKNGKFEWLVNIRVRSKPKDKRVLYVAEFSNGGRYLTSYDRNYFTVRSHSLDKFIARLERAKKPPGYMRADLFEEAKREMINILRRYLPVEHHELHSDNSEYDL